RTLSSIGDFLRGIAVSLAPIRDWPCLLVFLEHFQELIFKLAEPDRKRVGEAPFLVENNRRNTLRQSVQFGIRLFHHVAHCVNHLVHKWSVFAEKASMSYSPAKDFPQNIPPSFVRRSNTICDKKRASPSVVGDDAQGCIMFFGTDRQRLTVDRQPAGVQYQRFEEVRVEGRSLALEHGGQ